MTCTHDGRRAFIGCNDGTIRVWNLEAGEEIAQWRDHKGCVFSLDLSPDEKQLVSGGEDGVIRIWNVSTGQVIARAEGHKKTTDSVVFAPSGMWVASTGEDGAVRVWNAKTGEKLRDFSGQNRAGTTVAISLAEREIVSGGPDAKIGVFDIAGNRAGEPLDSEHQPKLHGRKTYGVESLQFLPGGVKLASHGADGTLQVWDFDKRTRLKSFTECNSWNFGVSSDGNRLAFLSSNRMKVVSLTQ